MMKVMGKNSVLKAFIHASWPQCRQHPGGALLTSFHLHGEYNGLQILQPLKHLESFILALGFGNLIEPLMTAISRTPTSYLTRMVLADPIAVLYLVQPSYLHLAHSLSTLKLYLSKGSTESPVDILPHLHRLEMFVAHHLYLPICPPGTSLPLTQTLQDLSLHSVSVQWMAGQVFPALKSCHTKFPYNATMIHPPHPF